MKQITIDNINETFYKKYFPIIFRKCQQILHNEDTALDATQEVFIKIIKSNTIIFNMTQYLLRVATNTSINILKKSSRTSFEIADLSLMPDKKTDISREVIEKLIIEDIHKQFDSKNRTIFLLCFIKKMKIKDIADIMNISVRAINKRIKKIKEKIRHFKENYYD